MRPPIYKPRGRAREYAPLALNLWGTCSHGCKYCYVPQQIHKKPEDFYVEGPPRTGILDDLSKQLAKDAGKQQPEICGGDRRVLLCFICDPYQPHENGFTRKALEILFDYHVPFSVLTKGGMRAARDFDLYADGAGHFGTTLTVGAPSAADWEPRAASIRSRLEAIRKAREMGIRTWVSIEPVISPDYALWIIDMLSGNAAQYGIVCDGFSAADYVIDEIRVGKLNYHPHAKTIDWAAFALDALAALQETNCKWRIKDDLFAYLPPGSPQTSSP